MVKITKDHLVSDVYSNLKSINKTVVKAVIDEFLCAMYNYLTCKDDSVIELRNFGVFKKTTKYNKVFLNPKTKERIIKDVVDSVSFRKSKRLLNKDKV